MSEGKWSIRPFCYLSVNTEYIQCMAISGFQGCPLTREHKCGNIMRILQSYKAKLPYGRNTKALQFVKYKSSALYVRGAIREIYESHISCHTKQYIVWQKWNTKAIRCMTEKYLVEKVCGVSIDTILGHLCFSKHWICIATLVFFAKTQVSYCIRLLVVALGQAP